MTTIKHTTLCFLLMFLAFKSYAQEPITEIIKQAIVKVIKAVDLKIQRLQNVTIKLQTAQKAIENVLSKTKLEEISGWVEKQRQLYADYYDELWKVKTAITYYRDIKSIIDKQKQLVAEYKNAAKLFRDDKHFTSDEIDYMEQVYTGMIDGSLNNVDLLMLVTSAFVTQMDDAQRLKIINETADNIDKMLIDLRVFNNSNTMLSLQRARDVSELETIKKYYGLE